MAESNKPNHSADTLNPPRKILRTVPTIVPTIMVEPERPYWECHQSPPPTTRFSPPDCPPLFTSNLSNNLVAAPSQQILVEASAQHLVMLFSGARQHADTSEETQVSMP